MLDAGPNIVDWLTLGVASAGTFITALIGVWGITRRDREVFDVHIEWEWTGQGHNPDKPFIYVHNRSAHTMSIIDLAWYTGVFRYTPHQGTAVYFEDVCDLNFPYAVEPSGIIKIYLDEDGAIDAYKDITTKLQNRLIFKKSVLALGMKTIRGSLRLFPAEKALPWSYRPEWMTGTKREIEND